MVSFQRFLNSNPLLRREKSLRFVQVILSRVLSPFSGLSKRSRDWDCLVSSGVDSLVVDSFREQYRVFMNDQVISRELFLHGQFDLEKLQKAHKHILRLNGQVRPTLVDVGANLGSISIPAVYREYFKAAIAIEANPKVSQALRENVVLNKLQSLITIHELVAGEKNQGPVSITHDETNFGASRVWHDADSGATAEVRPLDELIERIDEIGLVFMDVEGYEGKVLLGAQEILRSQIPVALEFSPKLLSRDTSKEDFCSLFQGYSGFYSLNDPLAAFWPIRKLGLIWDWYIEDLDGGQTDLLFV